MNWGDAGGGSGGPNTQYGPQSLGNVEEEREEIPAGRIPFYQGGGPVEWLLFFHLEASCLTTCTQSLVNQIVNFNTNTVL